MRNQIKFFALAYTDDFVELITANADENTAWELARKAMDTNQAVYGIKVAPMASFTKDAFQRGAFEKMELVELAKLTQTTKGGNDD